MFIKSNPIMESRGIQLSEPICILRRNLSTFSRVTLTVIILLEEKVTLPVRTLEHLCQLKLHNIDHQYLVKTNLALTKQMEELTNIYNFVSICFLPFL